MPIIEPEFQYRGKKKKELYMDWFNPTSKIIFNVAYLQKFHPLLKGTIKET